MYELPPDNQGAPVSFVNGNDRLAKFVDLIDAAELG
jgi:hypothetical protein